MVLPRWHRDKESACQCRRHKRHGFDIPDLGRSPGVGMATLSSSLTWEVPWTGEPGEQRVTKSRTQLSE